MKLYQQDLQYLSFDIPLKASLHLQGHISAGLSSNSAENIVCIKEDAE